MIHSPFHEGEKQIVVFRLNNSILCLEEISLVASLSGGPGEIEKMIAGNRQVLELN